MNRVFALAGLIVLASFVLGIVSYPALPDVMNVHWSASGAVNGSHSKLLGVFITPAMAAVIFLVFYIIPFIDPLGKNIAKFRKYYDYFVLILVGLLFYLNLLIYSWNLGARFDIISFILPAMAVMFFYGGVLMKHSEQSWFIGIRTPWTLSSKTVWRKTHDRGAVLFKFCAILMLVGGFFGSYYYFFVIIPVFLSLAYLVVYSYFEYTNEKKRSKRRAGKK